MPSFWGLRANHRFSARLEYIIHFFPSLPSTQPFLCETMPQGLYLSEIWPPRSPSHAVGSESITSDRCSAVCSSLDTFLSQKCEDSNRRESQPPTKIWQIYLPLGHWFTQICHCLWDHWHWLRRHASQWRIRLRGWPNKYPQTAFTRTDTWTR